jgi:acetyl-CoA carboxylase alpha subunit
MLERLVGTKRGTESNGHLPVDADLITDATQLASRPSPWEAVQAARNVKRPHSLDVITRAFDKFQGHKGSRGQAGRG